MATNLVFDKVLESEDGGETVFEITATVRDVYDLHKGEFLKIGNIRPDHAKKVTKRGERFARTSDRQKRWTEELARNKGILGNLSWNVDPEINDIKYDESLGRLTVTGKDGQPPVIRTPDSATRHRAIVDAVEAPMATINLDRLLSIRVWAVPYREEAGIELSEVKVFDSYNQDGKPVNATVAKFNYQRDSVERLVYELVLANKNLGLDNVETIQNSVSRQSAKLCAFNTLSTAFKDGWTTEVPDDPGFAKELEWVDEAWDYLVSKVPELEMVTLKSRKDFRAESVGGSAVLIHAYAKLLDKLRSDGLSLKVMDPLATMTVVLASDSTRTEMDAVSGQATPVHRSGDTVGFLSIDNPLWQTVGVVTAKERKDGTLTLETRNAYQTRVAAYKALESALGL